MKRFLSSCAALCLSLSTACTDGVGEGEGSFTELETSSVGSLSKEAPSAPGLRPQEWDPRSGLQWPGTAVHVQVLLRRGFDGAVPGEPASFLAFIIADGATVAQALQVKLSDQRAFRTQLDLMLETMQKPGTKHTYSIAGSLWIGPQPGPIGDELSPRYVARLLRSAGTMEDAGLAAAAFAP